MLLLCSKWKFCHFLMLIQTCMNNFLNIKEDILKNVNQQLMVAIDFHNMKKILWKSMATSNCLIINILQNIFVWVQQKRETHTTWGWLNDRILIFGGTVPLKSYSYLNHPCGIYLMWQLLFCFSKHVDGGNRCCLNAFWAKHITEMLKIISGLTFQWPLGQ